VTVETDRRSVDELDPRWVGAAIYQDRWHFHRQLYARYRVVLAPGEYKMIRTAIVTGTALLVEKRKGQQAIYSVRIPSARERVYVLAAGGNLITAWPPEKRLNETRRRLLAASSPARRGLRENKTPESDEKDGR
jgi:hypothetical protein